MLSIKKTIHTMAKPLIFLATALILSACGSDIEGTYSDKYTQIELNSGGKGYVSSRGNEIAVQYEVDGKRIVVTFPGAGNMVYTLMDNGDLKYRREIYKKKSNTKAEKKSNTKAEKKSNTKAEKKSNTKAEIKSNIKAGVMSLGTAEEANYADFGKYTTDLSKLLGKKEILEIANVKIELTSHAYRITAQSKEVPSITVIYDGARGEFVGY